MSSRVTPVGESNAVTYTERCRLAVRRLGTKMQPDLHAVTVFANGALTVDPYA